jgi:hypothetical protein
MCSAGRQTLRSRRPRSPEASPRPTSSQFRGARAPRVLQSAPSPTASAPATECGEATKMWPAGAPATTRAGACAPPEADYSPNILWHFFTVSRRCKKPSTARTCGTAFSACSALTPKSVKSKNFVWSLGSESDCLNLPTDSLSNNCGMVYVPLPTLRKRESGRLGTLHGMRTRAGSLTHSSHGLSRVGAKRSFRL